jgi:hypothetical protein
MNALEKKANLSKETLASASEKFSPPEVLAYDPAPVSRYDPSQESKWTRWGFTLESFKRAPGSTGGIKTHGLDTEGQAGAAGEGCVYYLLSSTNSSLSAGPCFNNASRTDTCR